MEDKRFEVVSQEGSGFSYLRAILVDKETGVRLSVCPVRLCGRTYAPAGCGRQARGDKEG